MPTVREIAQRCGVSQMTVSRALRDQPRVAEKTRRKIRKVAESLGYRPDPEIVKLMHYVRRGKRGALRSVICAISNWRPEKEPAYLADLAEGARERAGARGYLFSRERIGAGAPGQAEALRRKLRSRGVQGVLFLPMSPPVDLAGLLEWEEFSVVAASLSVLGPEMNRVAPNHFANTLRLCRELAARGYRRIGLVVDVEQDWRTNRGFSAAALSFGWHEARERVTPLVWEGDLAAAIRPWFRKEKPDLVLTTSEERVRACAAALGVPVAGTSAVGFASTNVRPGAGGRSPIAGIDEVPGEIGASAVDLLASLIERRERGLPKLPTATLLTGRWCAAG